MSESQATRAICEDIVATAGRDAKHLRLDQQIQRNKQIVMRLAELRNRINGCSDPDPTADKELRSAPSLLSLLENGPDELDNSQTAAHEILGEIEALLF